MLGRLGKAVRFSASILLAACGGALVGSLAQAGGACWRPGDPNEQRREFGISERSKPSYRTEQLKEPKNLTSKRREDRLIHPAQVRNLRVHMKLEGAAAAGCEWKIELKPEGEDIGTTFCPNDFTGGALWSDYIPTGAIHVALLGNVPEPARLVIDAYAYPLAPLHPQAITGRDQRIPIGGANSSLRDLGSGVARLRFMAAGVGEVHCTGFLITSQLLMTNFHCINTAEEARSAFAGFRYDSDFDQPVERGVAELIAGNPSLDYSVVRLRDAAPADAKAISMQAIGEVEPAENLAILQHPGGGPKQVSLAECHIVSVSVLGASGTAVDFGHSCDTIMGSSGSPVFSWNGKDGEGALVGLHHFGFDPSSKDSFNQAVRIGEIVDNINYCYAKLAALFGPARARERTR